MTGKELWGLSRMQLSNIDRAAKLRKKAIDATSRAKRNELAQHLTPKETAILAASLFSPTSRPLTCLDLGCGTGMLSAALLDRFKDSIASIEAIEIDPTLAALYEEEFAAQNCSVFIGDALTETPHKLYDRVILNPPYRKMASDDPRQKLLPVKAANLYSAFMSIALSRLADDGECVAIVPRSWMNGDYFKQFRIWALLNYSLDAIHVYGSRTEVFKDTSVLQETMLVKFSKRAQADTMQVSTSAEKADVATTRIYRTEDLVIGKTKVVRIAPTHGSLKSTIAGQGFCPSTGKVVDFRSRDRIYATQAEAEKDAKDKHDVYRLVYAGNFRTGTLVHPASIGKCQWYRADSKSTIAQLVNPGCYVLVKRFSSKEERHRVVAYPIHIVEPTAFENHTSFIHAGTPRNVVPLRSDNLAQGLSLWLNSTYIDEWFRDVSGSTQVNARDIKAMPCPMADVLESLGANWSPDLDQCSIDELVEDMR